MPTFDINLPPIIDHKKEGVDFSDIGLHVPWPVLDDRPDEVLHLPDTTWYLTALAEGMTSGAPSIALRFDVDPVEFADGKSIVVAETSLAAWIAATCALRGRFPDAFKGTPLEAVQ